MSRMRNDPSDRRLRILESRREEPRIRDETALIARGERSEKMMRRDVQSISIQVKTLLLDDKDHLPQVEHGVELAAGEVVEPGASPCDT
jgi:hypothetical protein